MRFFVLILLLLKSMSASTCQYTTSRGTFNLSKIPEGVIPTQSPTSNFFYYLSVCSNNAASPECHDTPNGVCAIQAEASTRKCWGLATWDNTGKVTSTSDGLSIEFDNGSADECSDHSPRSVQWIFKCDEGSEIGTIGIYEPKPCSYMINFPTKYVCDEYIIHTAMSGSGLSDGSIFLIILLVLIILYCAIGFGLNKYKKTADGLKAIPQSNFWCTQLPFWVRAGFMVSWAFSVQLFLRIRAKITGNPGNRERGDTDVEGTYENLD